MPTVTFEQQVVAFIDVLGFKSLVNKAAIDKKALAQLQELVDLLSSSVPTLNGKVDQNVPLHLVPKHISISDSIILSAPLGDKEYSWYDGLEIVVMRCIQLAHKFLNAGYLLRGGIEIGQVWHSGSNIVGPGYQEAYNLETKAEVPRILLGTNAKDHWDTHLRERNRMCLQRDNDLMVNGLHDYYIEGNSQLGVIQTTFDQYRTIIGEALASSLPAKEKAKWHWFSAYLETERARIAQ
jgi:hypothetical protein